MAWIGKWQGGKVWQAKDGTRTYYIWRMVNGRRYNISTRCTDERAAFRHLDRFEADPDAYVDGLDRLLLDQVLIDGYIGDLEQRGRSKGHIRRCKGYLAWLKERLTGDLKRTTTADLNQILEGSTSRGMRIAVLKAFWSWLEETGRVTTNPTRLLKVPPSIPAQWTRSKVIPKEHLNKVLPLLKEDYADILIVLSGTGWHVSEVYRLQSAKQLSDTGLHRERYREKNPFVLTTKHKSGDIHQTLVSLKVVEAAGRIIDRINRGEHFENPAAFYRAIAKACDDAGVPRFTPGRFRHTIASRAIEQGVAPEKVSAFLGHRSAATVRRFYATHAVRPKIPTME